jgi:uncharacterized protein YigE (DUF2233 family)
VSRISTTPRSCSLLMCTLLQVTTCLSQESSHPWLSRLLAEKGESRTFSVRGKKAALVEREVKDPMDSRVGLQLVFFTIPATAYEFSVFKVGIEGTAASLLANSAAETGAIVVVNGGYYGTNDNGKSYYPLGLLIHNGKQLVKVKEWTSGGVLYSNADKQSKIVQIRSFRPSPDILEALQSKPLLVEESHSGINSDDHQLANRTAIGIRADGSIVVAGAFSPSNNAMTLAEFAEVLRTPVSLGGAGVNIALNMDGGPSSLIICPSLNLKFGAGANTFITDGVRVSAR